MKPDPSSDVTRVMLLVLFIGLLLACSFWTLLPFLGALIWASTIVISTWSTLLWIQSHTGHRRGIAATIMTSLVLLAFVAPFLFAITTLIDAANSSPALLHDFLSNGVGPPPAWVRGIPVAGNRIDAAWTNLYTGGPDALIEAIRPYTRSAAAWALAATGGIGMIFVEVLLIVILVALLYLNGETAARGMLAFGFRLGGTRGEETIVLASKAIRSVALGVIVTALVQSILAGLGLWFSGIPHPGVLTAIAFVLGIAQLGPLPILAPAVAWLFWTGVTGKATLLLIWSLPVIALDNVLRPILIRRGMPLPLLLIIAGVIGGLIGFGVMGLFIGPVVLAASYTLIQSWIANGPRRQIVPAAPTVDAAVDTDPMHPAQGTMQT